MPLPDKISALVSSKRVIVCCGSGGVGKTTTSAALALRAAAEGKNAVVITIDPAKRLATSLGLKALTPTATDLTNHIDEALKDHPPLKGRFSAVMPDTQQTFEQFVRSMAGEDQGLAGRVLRTSIYKIFAKEFSGANEYMAMEKLYQLYSDPSFDLIVLDTPPSANTRGFLEAPRMLADFFDDRIIRWLVAPGSKLLASGLKKIMEILEKLTGRGFVADLIEFASALFAMRAQFTENLKRVGELLHQDDVAFLMVTSPERLSKQDTQEFVRVLEEQNYRFWGFVVNRVLSRRLGLSETEVSSGSLNSDALAEKLESSGSTLDAAELKTLKSAFNQLKPTLEHEQEAARFLSTLSKDSPDETQVALVPEQPSDVHSVSALLKVSQQLGA